MITEGCVVEGNVSNSVLFANVRVAQGAVVESSILMPGAVVEEGAEVCYSIIAENAVIKKGASVGPKAMLEKDVQDGEKLW